MIGKVEFLNLPGSMSSCEYPLLTSANQSLTSYTLASFNNVKFSLDLVQTIRVPYFSNYDKANCVRMNGEIYWITAVRNETMADTTLMFALQYNGASSLVHKSDIISGLWERSGNTDLSGWMKYQPYSGQSYTERSVRLPNISDLLESSTTYYWVQFTSTEYVSINTTANPYAFVDGIAQVNKQQDYFGIYGLFITPNPVTNVYYQRGSTTDTDIRYPQIDEFINNIEKYGFTASNITNISISERCPYTIESVREGVKTSFLPHIYYGDAGSNLQVIYNITDNVQAHQFHTYTVELNASEHESRIGDVNVRNSNGGIVATVPLKYCSGNIHVTTYGDMTGVYTKLQSLDDYWICNIPEGKLPWMGSTWEEYRAYSMAFDRQSMQNANTKEAVNAIGNAFNGLTSGIMTGAIVGGPVGAAVGFMSGMSGMVGSAVSYKGNVEYQKSEQANLEKRMEAQPGTAYSPEDGLSYIYECISYGAKITFDMPLGYSYDSTWADTYIDKFGYPADNILDDLTISEGYYKGKLLYTTAFARGLKFDECNSEFINGFRYKEV